jgi:hypothetical protein
VKRIQLRQIAHARSGDKGTASNVGLIANDVEAYRILRDQVTPERVKKHFGDIVKGDVVRYELPNLLSLNFILHDSLGGGGSESLRTDAQGKTHGQAMLLMTLDVPDETPVSAITHQVEDK